MKLWVRCPACGWEQATRAKEYVRCHRCGHAFKLRPRKGRSRIVGSYEEGLSRRKRMWGSSLAWDYFYG